MKKIIICLLCLITLVGCENKQNKKEINYEEQSLVCGGYSINCELPEINDLTFDQARKKLTDITYSPLFVLGTQTVSGKNIAYLAYEIKDDKISGLKIVKVYNSLDNESEILNVNDFDFTVFLSQEGSTTPEGLSGGWIDNEELPCFLDDETKELFDKAFEELEGVDYSPVALLGTQVVSGINYVFLVQGRVVYPGAKNHLYIISIYKNLEGKIELSNICGIDLNSFN